ncbi:hypothetical protein Mal48_13150 [Thalassoglobus polymorphus]|uniref:Uncharacterized protein n=1 Tax=Thalassoglobus polymorphus TaxID=2527994 RepID=A0A517QKE9_9PLAN|nr:hypothetical protein Mal48_13150 [Thalassoglobus polymorphus]
MHVRARCRAISRFSWSHLIESIFNAGRAREERISLLKMLFATRQILQTNSKDTLAGHILSARLFFAFLGASSVSLLLA